MQESKNQSQNVHPRFIRPPGKVASSNFGTIRQEHDRDGDDYKLLMIGHFPQLSLFHTSFGGKGENILIVRYSPPQGGSKELRISLRPHTSGLVTREIFSDFFSACLGFPTRLVYLDSSRRPVIGNIAPMEQPGANSCSLLGRKVEISFADIAPIMITSMASLRCVDDMIGEEMDVTKFRPNMVVSMGGGFLGRTACRS
ncbi:hypothetical protein B9Z19DRAFT_1085167 [Tuber borchii]|uniref:MOSC domain-containing protein n=1 Tax=Tuber borchii TaxID=42251 RepID=A0A2T6ZR49_TUBBO|nr:hypothetical protein B9Z19DRAFT_1085167 [Tuber borchii]